MLFSIELFPTSCGVRSRHPLSFSEKVCDTIDYHSRLTLCLSSWKERTLCASLFQALEGLCQEREHPSDRCQGQGTGGRPRARRDGHLELAGTGQHMPGAARRDSVTLSPPSSTPAAPIPAPPHRGWAVRSPGPLRIPLGRGQRLGRRRSRGGPRPFVGEKAQVLPVEAGRSPGWGLRPSKGAEPRQSRVDRRRDPGLVGSEKMPRGGLFLRLGSAFLLEG